ncbi:MAG: TOBE domain-containing protein [Sedimentisphaerales bacterium]|nr:TOBE domain-containing protein [Sedimentisphaerales bacterium]
MLSARNQLSGEIKSISRGEVTAEVIIITSGGVEISSIITLGSCVRMNLEPGDNVIAVVKASDVIVAIGSDFVISCRNNIQGIIKKIISGPVSNEIVIDADGTELVSIITQSSVKRLKLIENMKVSALIKASNVIVMK